MFGRESFALRGIYASGGYGFVHDMVTAAGADTGLVALTAIPNDVINPLFEAAIDATSEAILNAMLAAETMTGANGYRVHALPHDRLIAALRKYGRIR